MTARKMQTSVLALAAACAWAVPAQAEDADTAALRQQLSEMRAQMAAMAEQMNAMQSRLDSAQAKAEAAEDAANDAAQTAQVAAATAADAKAESDTTGAFAKAAKWAADTKISGRMYYNVSSVNAKDAAGNKVESDGGFELKRFYLGVDHKFDDTFAGNVTMDVSPVDNGGKAVGYGFYIKKAYLEAKLAKELKLRLGSADMPWIPYVEGVYGYRHIEKTLTDLDSFGTSADWGVHASGDLADGVVSYQVSAVDGAGYREPKFTETIDFEGRISAKFGGFNVAVGGYTGELGKDVTGAAPYRTATRFNAMLAYKDEIAGMPVTIGGEYFTAKNWKVLQAAPKDKAEGYSLFASIAPVEQWSVFGRLDHIEPFKNSAPLMQDDFMMFGVQFSPATIVDFALVYKRDNADGGLKIGNLGSGQEKRDEVGLYGQFRF
ncbi:hypothetical protein GRI89_14715 [Altererythrobacter salegens]|uniref:Porin n=1 Tax=Croceibacterium salegens TaxID=1737568 RepID=A0A6I4SY78_9SPHN|nr:hypothetical protein [Croceibacterium salegens]MXO60793.1 hypothetical protein [Croceibacterium salegens]